MLMMKFIGKPYAGKPHVRFDEGVGKDFFLPALLYCNKMLRTYTKGTEVSQSSTEDYFNSPKVL